jgi:hypothetical protein
MIYDQHLIFTGANGPAVQDPYALIPVGADGCCRELGKVFIIV